MPVWADQKLEVRGSGPKALGPQHSVELNKEITVNDYKNLNACLVDDVIYIRDDGRKAKRVFNLINHYYRVVIEEVSYDIIMDNNYIKEVPIETPEDESLYNMSLWRMF